MFFIATLFGSFESINKSEIVDYIRPNKDEMYADGSIKNAQGSMAFCFAGQGDTIIFKQHASIHGNPSRLILLL